MFKTVILFAAKQDIKESALWYNTRQYGPGKKFTGQVRQKIRIIKQGPFSKVIRYDYVRTAVLDIFPFMIHYAVDEDNEAILITAVLHTSRNPEIWEKTDLR